MIAWAPADAVRLRDDDVAGRRDRGRSAESHWGGSRRWSGRRRPSDLRHRSVTRWSDLRHRNGLRSRRGRLGILAGRLRSRRVKWGALALARAIRPVAAR